VFDSADNIYTYTFDKESEIKFVNKNEPRPVRRPSLVSHVPLHHARAPAAGHDGDTIERFTIFIAGDFRVLFASVRETRSSVTAKTFAIPPVVAA